MGRFSRIGKAGIIPEKFKKIVPMAGFGNILVHQYDEIDVDLTCKFIKERLDDLVEFVSYIRKYVRTH